MSSKKHAKAHNNRQQKKEQFSHSPLGKGGNLKFYVAIIALIAVVGYLAMGALNQNSTTTAPSATAVQPTPGASEIRIPLSDVGGGEAKFYETALTGNRTARFFVLKTSDGVYRAALDACEVCFAGHNGYHQEGDEMVCNKCGRHFLANTVNNGTTGCHPFSLTRTVEGQSLVLKVNELENGSKYF